MFSFGNSVNRVDRLQIMFHSRNLQRVLLFWSIIAGSSVPLSPSSDGIETSNQLEITSLVTSPTSAQLRGFKFESVSTIQPTEQSLCSTSSNARPTWFRRAELVLVFLIILEMLYVVLVSTPMEFKQGEDASFSFSVTGHVHMFLFFNICLVSMFSSLTSAFLRVAENVGYAIDLSWGIYISGTTILAILWRGHLGFTVMMNILSAFFMAGTTLIRGFDGHSNLVAIGVLFGGVSFTVLGLFLRGCELLHFERSTKWRYAYFGIICIEVVAAVIIYFTGEDVDESNTPTATSTGFVNNDEAMGYLNRSANDYLRIGFMYVNFLLPLSAFAFLKTRVRMASIAVWRTVISHSLFLAGNIAMTKFLILHTYLTKSESDLHVLFIMDLGSISVETTSVLCFALMMTRYMQNPLPLNCYFSRFRIVIMKDPIRRPTEAIHRTKHNNENAKGRSQLQCKIPARQEMISTESVHKIKAVEISVTKTA